MSCVCDPDGWWGGTYLHVFTDHCSPSGFMDLLLHIRPSRVYPPGSIWVTYSPALSLSITVASVWDALVRPLLVFQNSTQVLREAPLNLTHLPASLYKTSHRLKLPVYVFVSFVDSLWCLGCECQWAETKWLYSYSTWHRTLHIGNIKYLLIGRNAWEKLAKTRVAWGISRGCGQDVSWEATSSEELENLFLSSCMWLVAGGHHKGLCTGHGSWLPQGERWKWRLELRHTHTCTCIPACFLFCHCCDILKIRQRARPLLL